MELNPNDRVVVRNHRLTIYSVETAILNIPDLRFGANRALTIGFYFTIDNFGTKNVRKEFGFIFGQYKLFFMPEQDDAGIDQFRYIYIQRDDQEPEQHRITTFTFLEGERVRCVINLSQDGISFVHLSRLGAHADDVFTVPMPFTFSGLCHPVRSNSAPLGIYISASECEKSFSIESLSLLQETVPALDPNVDLAWPFLMRRAHLLLHTVSPFLISKASAVEQEKEQLDNRARLIHAVLALLVEVASPERRVKCQDVITTILKHIDRIVLRTKDISKLINSLRLAIDLFEYYVALDNTEEFEEEKAWLCQLIGHAAADDEHRCSELLHYRNGVILVCLQQMLTDDAKLAWKEVLMLREQAEYDNRQVHPVLMMQRAALFCLQSFAKPQRICEVVMRAIDLKMDRRRIGRIDEHSIEEIFEGQDICPTYTKAVNMIFSKATTKTASRTNFKPVIFAGDTNITTT
jgi:hypothetical protein